jgi:hypothetical protein
MIAALRAAPLGATRHNQSINHALNFVHRVEVSPTECGADALPRGAAGAPRSMGQRRGPVFTLEERVIKM